MPEKVIVYLAIPGQKLVSGVIEWGGGIWHSYFALVRAAKNQEKLSLERDTLLGKIVEYRVLLKVTFILNDKNKS